jgi:hypothetical protein
MSLKEEYALGMEQRSSDAAAKDVQIKPIKEVCALGMEPAAAESRTVHKKRGGSGTV